MNAKSKPGFLRDGNTSASFQASANRPVSKERLISLVTTGNRTSSNLITIGVGIGVELTESECYTKRLKESVRVKPELTIQDFFS